MTDLSTRPVRPAEAPRLIRMHTNDNVAIVANDAGLRRERGSMAA